MLGVDLIILGVVFLVGILFVVLDFELFSLGRDGGFVGRTVVGLLDAWLRSCRWLARAVTVLIGRVLLVLAIVFRIIVVLDALFDAVAAGYDVAFDFDGFDLWALVVAGTLRGDFDPLFGR